MQGGEIVKSQQGKNKKKNSGLWITLILVLVVLLGILITANLKKQDEKTDSSAERSENTAESAQEQEDADEVEEEDSDSEDAGLEFPYEFEEEELSMESLFQYSGINPDAQNEECEDTASIQLKNTSDRYLESAEISVELTDGTEFSFVIQDIPAGRSVMAFDTENNGYDGKTGVAFVDAKTNWSDVSMNEESIKIVADENGTQITNMTDKTIEALSVKYHDVLDEMYFGGGSFMTEITEIGSGETTTANTSESILGEAEVVCVDIKE